MGELILVPKGEFDRALALPLEPAVRATLFADLCRINVLYMVSRAGSGHLGTCFSSLDLIAWLLLGELEPECDVLFSSKGHDAPALYAALIGVGRIPFDLIHRLRRLGGLPGHPDVSTPGVSANTGSLGMGISKAKGLVRAARQQGERRRVYVITGDGELQEGQLWESLPSAANDGLAEITAIVDHNKLQSDTHVSCVSNLGDLEAKWRSFGWAVRRCDGHDPEAFRRALGELRSQPERPGVVIADTVKGRGVSFMEHTALVEGDRYSYHSGTPTPEEYVRASEELLARVDERLRDAGAGALRVATQHRESAPRPAASKPARLIDAYARALLEQAERNPDLVVLDADLVFDTGLGPFRERFPERFYECGIAEQDMVSQAGGMALSGLLPVVHSFGCFLSARPNEQIYNNATERTRIVYVGSLAGVLPGGPGHSHQAVRDIASLAAVPGLVAIEPATESEVVRALDYCANRAAGPSYLRLVSIPCQLPFELPTDASLEPGRGVTLTAGEDALLISHGPVMLAEAVKASRVLESEHRIGLGVVNLPWLNRIDADWLRDEVRGRRCVFSLEDHYEMGGQGDRIAAVLAAQPLHLDGGGAPCGTVPLERIALREIPVCGTAEEVLAAHGLDARSIVDRVRSALGSA